MIARGQHSHQQATQHVTAQTGHTQGRTRLKVSLAAWRSPKAAVASEEDAAWLITTEAASRPNRASSGAAMPGTVTPLLRLVEGSTDDDVDWMPFEA